MKISQLATELNCQLEGDPERAVLHIASLDDAGPQDLSFLTDSRYTPKVRLTRAGAVILPRDFPAAQLPSGTTALRVADPQVAFARAIALLSPAWRPAPGIHPTASVDPTASIGSDAFLGPYVVIGAHCRLGRNAVVHAHSVLYPNVIVGDDFTAHAHVVVREGVRIGNAVILQPGVVLGGDGYGFVRDGERGYMKIPQVGNVVIGDGVEVQANSCIDRSTVAQTVIGPGTKIDNLVHVAHNCKIGARVLLCAQVGLAGSTVVEDDAILAGQVGVAGHCVIGRGAIITAQSGTHGDLAGGKMYSGSPAFEHGQWLRSCSLFPRLTEMYRSIEHLRRKLEEEATKS